jgi:hypothetical protein
MRKNNFHILAAFLFSMMSVFGFSSISAQTIKIEEDWCTIRSNCLHSGKLTQIKYINNSKKRYGDDKRVYLDPASGLGIFSRNGKYGLINSLGEIIVKPIYDGIDRGWFSFKNTYTFPHFQNGLLMVIQSGKYGYIDQTGKVIVPFNQYEDAGAFLYRDLAPVKKNGKWGYINRKGEIAIPCSFDGVACFSNNGLAAVSQKGKIGFINTDGSFVVPFKYEGYKTNGIFDQVEFRHGYAVVMTQNKKGILHESGQQVVECKYDNAEIDYNKDYSFSYFRVSNRRLRNNIYKWRWIDSLGREFGTFQELVSSNKSNTSPKKQLNDLAVIEWKDFSPTTSEKQFTLKAGIKTKSKIKSCRIMLNDIEMTNDKGIIKVKANEYDMEIDRTLTLANGQNTIKIEVVNEVGKAVSEKKVTYKTTNVAVKEKRLALIIGNSAYTSSCFPRLKNSLNDARVMYDKFKSLGFDMRPLVLDADRAKMWNAIEDFVNEAERSNYEVAIIYYSGHGLSPDGGANYLIPVDANIRYLDEVKRDGINSQTDLIAKLEEKKCRVKIALLDCCNNCNVPERNTRSSVNHGGMSMMHPQGISILHAAQPRKTAMDGLSSYSKNSPFVEAFVECADKFGNQPWQIFITEVTNAVDKKTNGQQIPYPEGQLRGNYFYLNPNHQ